MGLPRSLESSETTEQKLDQLKFLFPHAEDTVLLELLSMCNGDVRETKRVLGVEDLLSENRATQGQARYGSARENQARMGGKSEWYCGLNKEIDEKSKRPQKTQRIRQVSLDTFKINKSQSNGVLKSNTASKSSVTKTFLQIHTPISNSIQTTSEIHNVTHIPVTTQTPIQGPVPVSSACSKFGSLSLNKLKTAKEFSFSKKELDLPKKELKLSNDEKKDNCLKDTMNENVSEDGNGSEIINDTFSIQGTQTSLVTKRQATLHQFINSDSTNPSKINSNFSRITHIYDPTTLHARFPSLPCTLHFQVFPPELATRLLTTLLSDSHNWTTSSFYMFERKVSARHSTCLYTSDEDVFLGKKKTTYNGQINSKGDDGDGNKEDNGSHSGKDSDTTTTTIKMFTKEMHMARKIIESIVNQEIVKRGFSKYQHDKPWRSNVTVCNKYVGGQECVGYHSDQLTHLGPQCVIASVSLGVTREFRLKKREYGKEKKQETNKGGGGGNTKRGGEGGAVSIHLPHNSLIIMHAGCQEEYKHTLMPATKIDRHAVGGNVRINITYRMYLEQFEDSKNPRCFCNKPMILRTMRNRNRNKEQEGDCQVQTGKKEKEYEYMWMCGNGYSGKENCKKMIFPKF